MTQPPNQPPQGGFGAPQEPQPNGPQPPAQSPTPPGQPPQMPPQSQPGYGYPQAPQPGYGYPQTPPSGYGYPQQPAQPGPYGAPQSGPYGQPQQPGPYAQPQYGYPQQQPYPGPSTGGSGGGGKNPFTGRTGLIIAAAVAGLLVIGGTVWAVVGGGDDKKPTADKNHDPKSSASAPVNPGDGSGDGGKDPENLNKGRRPGEAKVLWYKPAPDVPGSGADAPGMWVTKKVAVKAAYKQLSAYNVSNGEPAWGPLSLPYKICGASKQTTDDNKIVVAYMSGVSDKAKCNQLMQVDLNTGKSGWKKEVPEEGLFDIMTDLELTISGNTVTATRLGGVSGFRVSDGKKLFGKFKGDCQPDAFAGGAKLIAAESCGTSDAEQVQEVDPNTGKPKWTFKLPKGWKVSHIYAVDPVVIHATNEAKKTWNISTLKANGTLMSQVSVNEKFAPECGLSILSRNLQGCLGATVGKSNLYLPTKPKTVGGANEVVAIDLATGKERWRVKSPDGTLMPMQVEGGRLIAYAEPTYSKPGAVYGIPFGSKKPEKILQHPQGTAQMENGFFSKDVAYADGRFYISTTTLSGSTQGQQKLMMAFGK
ncbi:outer membrane protein assembly factor BamB family protein [Streptomyces sp. NPDC002004]